jgi:diacylglycerol kinase (ATP)
MNNKSFHWRSRLKSFGYAFEGLRYLVLREPNTRLHAFATFFVVSAGYIKGLSPVQWIAICICIAVVLVSEIFNTCIESICDLVCGNEYNANVKIIKDIAAAAVLIAAAASVVVALIVFFS